MPKEYSRAERVADAIQRELAVVIREQVRDPRIGMVSVNAVKVSGDLSVARVFVTFIDNPSELAPEERVKQLNKAAGYMRGLLATEIRMRSVPQLRFEFDKSVYRALEISDLIDQAIESDAAKRGDSSQ